MLADDLRDLKSAISDYEKYMLGKDNKLFNGIITEEKVINADGSISTNPDGNYVKIDALESGTYTLLYQNNVGNSTTIRVHEYSANDEWIKQNFVITETSSKEKVVVFNISNPTIKISCNKNVHLILLFKGTKTIFDLINEKITNSGLEEIINSGYLSTEYKWESGKISNGIDVLDSTRIRTIGYYSTDSTPTVYPLDGYELYVVYYDENYSFTNKHTAWFTNPYTILSDYPYYRMILRRADLTDITTDESVNVISRAMLNILYYNELDVKNSVINSGLYNGASFTFIGDLLYVFSYSSNNDYTVPTTNYRYKYNPAVNSLETYDTFASNMGHQNTVDYCEQTDCLLSSSGGNSSNPMPSEIFIFPNASERNDFDVTSEDVIRINVSNLDWGKQLNCVWGDANYNRHNIIYCITNYEQGNMDAYGQSHPNAFTGDSKRYIRRVLLGTGANRLENGTFKSGVSDNEFNGTYKVLNMWEREFVYEEANNDTCFYDGRIYENIVSNNGGQRYVISEFNDFGETLNVKKIEIPVYDTSGDTLAVEGQGITIKYGKLFIGASQVNIYNQWRKN